MFDTDTDTEQDNDIFVVEPDIEEASESIENEADDSLTDETPDDNSVIRQLRQKIKEQQRLLRQNQTTQHHETENLVLPELPTYEGCDYNEETFNTKLAEYYDIKSKIALQEDKKRKQQEQEANNVREQFENQVKALNKKDAETKINLFANTVDANIGKLILSVASNKALVAYVLGSKPEVLDTLESEFDPNDIDAFKRKVIVFESKIKMKTQQTIKPNTVVKGNVAPSKVSGDKQLARLEEEAIKTGDRSKVIAYKRQLKSNKS